MSEVRLVECLFHHKFVFHFQRTYTFFSNELIQFLCALIFDESVTMHHFENNDFLKTARTHHIHEKIVHYLILELLICVYAFSASYSITTVLVLVIEECFFLMWLFLYFTLLMWYCLKWWVLMFRNIVFEKARINGEQLVGQRYGTQFKVQQGQLVSLSPRKSGSFGLTCKETGPSVFVFFHFTFNFLFSYFSCIFTMIGKCVPHFLKIWHFWITSQKELYIYSLPTFLCPFFPFAAIADDLHLRVTLSLVLITVFTYVFCSAFPMNSH